MIIYYNIYYMIIYHNIYYMIIYNNNIYYMIIYYNILLYIIYYDNILYNYNPLELIETFSHVFPQDFQPTPDRQSWKPIKKLPVPEIQRVLHLLAASHHVPAEERPVLTAAECCCQ